MEYDPKCPDCGEAVSGGDSRCRRCGYPMDAPETEPLRANAWRYWQLARERQQLDGELRRLGAQRAELLRTAFARLAPAAGGVVAARTAAPVAGAAPQEWDARRIRNVLLWLGSVLLGLSAVGFAGYEWTRFDSGGRACILVGVTLVVCAAGPLVRRRLPATAESMAALGQGLLVVDWALVRHAGLGAGLGPITWWAIGSVVLAVVGLGLGWVGLQAGRIIGALGAVAALPLLIATQVRTDWAPSGELWVHVALWAAMAAVDVAAARLLWSTARWRSSAMVCLAGAACLQAVAYVQAVVLTVGVLTLRLDRPVLAAVAVAASAAAPALVRALWSPPVAKPGMASWGDATVFAVTAAVMTAVVLAVSAAVQLAWLPVVALAVAAVSLGGRRLLPASLRPGLWAVGFLVAAAGSVVALVPAVESVLGPLAWWRHGWSGALSLRAASHLSGPLAVSRRPLGIASPYVRPSGLALAALASLGACVVAGTDWRAARHRPASLMLAILAVPAIALAPLVAGADIAAVIVTEALVVTALVASAAVAFRRSASFAPPVAATAAAVTVPCLGWSTVVPSATVVVVGLGLAWTLILAFSARCSVVARLVTSALAAVFLLSLAGVSCAAAAFGSVVSAFVVVLAASVLLVGLRWLPAVRPASTTAPLGALVTIVAIAGLLVPELVALILGSWLWLAADLTVAIVSSAAAGLRPGGAGYRWAAGIGTMPLTWCWLLASGVRLLEAYTWPTALALGLLAVAATRSGDGATRSSWVTYGPALALALIPSTSLAISQSGLARPIVVTSLAVAVVLAGVRWRLRSPIVLGGATLVLLALNAAWPYVTMGPRWVALGVAGAVVLWLGVTIERRMAGLRSLCARYRHLG